MSETDPAPTGDLRGKQRDRDDIDSVRLAAFGLLRRASTHRRSIDGPLRAAASSFSDRDRRFLWALVIETLRWQLRLDALIAPLLRRPLVHLDPVAHILLRMAACQVCKLDQVPDHAIVDEGVRLARRFTSTGAAKLVNAVSHRLVSDGQARWDHLEGAASPSDWSVTHSHPGWMVERWRKRWGDERTLAILRWNNEQAPVWLRARPGGPKPDGEPGWVPDTFKMPDGYSPAEDSGFLEGHWTVQDPSEALVALLAPENASRSIVDLCAAPGTKTSHLASRYSDSQILAMDRSKVRIGRLLETLNRTGARADVVVGDGTTVPLRPGGFDGVLVDAPCSALGVLRRRVDARWNVRESDLARHGKQQRRILESAAGLPRVEGWLLYSVCSTEKEETTDIYEWFLATNSRFRARSFDLAIPKELLVDTGAVRILPGQNECDGVYACLFECCEEDH